MLILVLEINYVQHIILTFIFNFLYLFIKCIALYMTYTLLSSICAFPFLNNCVYINNCAAIGHTVQQKFIFFILRSRIELRCRFAMLFTSINFGIEKYEKCRWWIIARQFYCAFFDTFFVDFGQYNTLAHIFRSKIVYQKGVPFFPVVEKKYVYFVVIF